MNISTNIKLHSIIKEPEAQEIKQAAADLRKISTAVSKIKRLRLTQ